MSRPTVKKLKFPAVSLLDNQPSFFYPFWDEFDRLTSHLSLEERRDLKLKIERGQRVVITDHSFEIKLDDF